MSCSEYNKIKTHTSFYSWGFGKTKSNDLWGNLMFIEHCFANMKEKKLHGHQERLCGIFKCHLASKTMLKKTNTL